MSERERESFVDPIVGPPVLVLNVNDTDAARYTITRMLKRAGFTVIEAATGTEALASVRANKPDVVVLDVKLPDMNGFEVCRQIKADPAIAQVAVLMTSAAFVRAGDRVQGLEGGADAYLVQPAEAIELAATVKALVRVRRAEDERNLLLTRERAARALAEAAQERTSRLHGLAAQLSEAVTVAQIAEAVVAHVVAVMDARAGAIFQLEPTGTALDLVYASGYPPERTEHWRRIAVTTDVAAAEAVRTGRAIYVETRAAWDARYPAVAPRSFDAGPERSSRVAVPLIVKAQAVGVLVLSFAESRSVDEADREYILAVARQGAQALERARLYEAERHARDRAEQASRAKDEFLATVSHELRTPLNAILGWAQMLRSGQLADGKRARALEALERNARAQAQLVEDILDVSRIISGRLRVEFRAVDLAAVTHSASEAVRPAAEARGVQLELACDDDVGLVAGDPDRLQQVAWNLLNNAVKFTPRGGHVRVALRRVGAQVELEVTDSGQGIAPDLLPYVFERFWQADSTTSRSHGGLGLGLAIVRHLVELHGGSVRAASHGEGQGATFTVALPLRAVPVDEEDRASIHPMASERLTLTGLPDLTGLRVLVVDDEADARELVATVLEQCGAGVTTVSSAREALAALARGPTDLLVSDIGMPGEDGYALIRAVRARPEARALPAAALTAYARPDDARLALDAGFQRHVSKPVEPAALIAMVAELTGRATGKRASSPDAV